jgi:hypothetical protein
MDTGMKSGTKKARLTRLMVEKIKIAAEEGYVWMTGHVVAKIRQAAELHHIYAGEKLTMSIIFQPRMI